MSAQIKDWNDIRVAYEVAKRGTLSAAAEALNVHHSTVLRRISALEESLNTRLFHRHARGYVPTDAGKMLLGVAEYLEDDLERLFGQLQGIDQQLSGNLVLTTVSSFVPLLAPLLREFQDLYPNITLDLLVEPRRLKLEHGEAHIGIRPGRAPEEPDYVAQRISPLASSLFASKSYVERYGSLTDLSQINNHRFVSGSRSLHHLPFLNWIKEQVPPERIFYQANDVWAMYQGIRAGLGIGLMSNWAASQDQEIVIPQPLNIEEPGTDLWVVTHRDLHRTSRVQAFLEFFKEAIKKQQRLLLSWDK
ncbi:LysR family transcriptional regulator [Motiliproteus sp. MSK22-1]|uniref:LysR family transcriptional regulator n=1 Tax=Motiliproteus sp. MSK22-1 TaxID=1897630 RepID=UPI000975F19A|nr:LysR family transcriptional regulator [Motiliproteus sp. MSK22-1]OMH33988.1 hypothetical protein BGP75_13575 [Motiliproteus sp. MSK22-1]